MITAVCVVLLFALLYIIARAAAAFAIDGAVETDRKARRWR